MCIYIINVIVVRNHLVAVSLANLFLCLAAVMAIPRLKVKDVALDFVNDAIEQACLNLTGLHEDTSPEHRTGYLTIF